MGEVPPSASDLPDALVGLAPRRLQHIQHPQLHLPRRGLVREALTRGLVQQVEYLAVHVELELA
jgi:hypothetical protein